MGSAPASSPPARGSSSIWRIEAAALLVVPARAGIFRVLGGASRRTWGRPRPRGDLPPADERVDHRLLSSPPARGSSGWRDAGGTAGVVVPARAGIFPPAWSSWRSSGSRPRPRGDLPSAVSPVAVRPESSPPARGSSDFLASGVTWGRVVPAARGSSPFRPGGTGRHRVVPARAGIFLARPRPCIRCAGRPRPRGDLPLSRGRRLSGVWSFPPARGSSSDGRRRICLGAVVPARAGVFCPAGYG